MAIHAGEDLGGNVWKKRLNENRSRSIVATKPKSAAMAAVLELVSDMERSGLINKRTMREYEELCTAPPEYTPADVRGLEVLA